MYNLLCLVGLKMKQQYLHAILTGDGSIYMLIVTIIYHQFVVY